MQTSELSQRIADLKRQFGSRVCILGHHYQSDEVLDCADFVGDSLVLSQQAAEQTQAEYIVFCGVHFMAESADILSAEHQRVCLPNLRAGCAMAEMADADAVTSALDEVAGLTSAKVMPITYVNSTAAIKAITARHGGACCTSSNVANVFSWALQTAGAKKIFAIPDQHLGRNTAIAMGYRQDDCVVYDGNLPDGGLSKKALDKATFILWKGHCHVHQVFKPEHITAIRRLKPGIEIIVHPECPREIVAAADASGSTEQIIRAVTDAPAGSSWAVGTESNLVRRLGRNNPDKFVCMLSPASATCWQMAQINLQYLLWCLDSIAQGKAVNVIRVPADVACDAKIALQRMLDSKAVVNVIPSK